MNDSTTTAIILGLNGRITAWIIKIKNMDIYGNVLGDFMALDLVTLRWMSLSNIIYKIKGQKLSRETKNGIPRVYHSSCLVLSFENMLKGSKLNIYKK